MLTLDPVFKAALDNGGGTPIIEVRLVGGQNVNTRNVLYYKLDGLELTVQVAGDGTKHFSSYLYMTLVRGLNVDGVEYTTNSSTFYIIDKSFKDGIATYKGHMFGNKRISGVDGHQTSGGVLNYAFAQIDLYSVASPIAIYPSVDHISPFPWFYYANFFPAGKYLTLNNADTLPNLFAQKYFATLRHADNSKIRVYSSTSLDQLAYNYGLWIDAWYLAHPDTEPTIDDVPAAYKTFYSPSTYGLVVTPTTISDFQLKTRSSFPFYAYWRDEADTLHEQGTTTGKGYNIGYVENGVTVWLPETGYTRVCASGKISPPKLYLENGDFLRVSVPAGFLVYGSYGMIWEQVVDLVEVFDPNQSPAWYTYFERTPDIENTSGGAMPSTIERVSNFTPLGTSGFDNVLSSADNNLQAAMETLDEHDHDLAPIAAPTATSNFLVGAQVAGVWSWVKKTLAEVKTILGLGSAAYTDSSDYATAAKGVTNGDSHNHVGGDGAQIDHTGLANKGTNTHATIDTHLAAASPHSGHAITSHSHTGTYEPANANIQTHISASAPHSGHALTDHSHSYPKTSWTPTFTNLSVGNGTLTCEYTEVGNQVHAEVHLVFGSTTSISGSVTLTLPSGSMTTKAVQPLGMLTCNDAGTAQYSGIVHQSDANSVLLRTFTVSGSNIVQSVLSSTVPFTWATGDRLTAEFTYIKA